jgi:hypothetical protein
VQHSSEFYFGLKRFDAVVAEGQPLPVELIAVKPAGEPLDAPVRATIRLTRIKWQTNRLATAGDTSEFESTPQLQVVWEKELTTVPASAPIANLRSRGSSKCSPINRANIFLKRSARTPAAAISDVDGLRRVGRGRDGLGLSEPVRDRRHRG